MKDLIVTSGIVGLLLPALIALVNQAHWPSGFKAVVAFIACFIAAGITAWAEGTLTFANWATSLIVVFTTARTTYAGLWRPTGVAPALESSTTVKKP